ncbi:MAG: hypothetical protein OEN23_09100 [Paracoccaceae bacterium]|nr:hypothetical protein [Paracoccaceae bacterium]
MKYAVYLNKFALSAAPLFVFLGYFKINIAYYLFGVEYGLIIHLYISMLFMFPFMMSAIILTFLSTREKFLYYLERPRLTLPIASGVYWHSAFFSIIGIRVLS